MVRKPIRRDGLNAVCVHFDANVTRQGKSLIGPD
jgi:hypothetical protein